MKRVFALVLFGCFLFSLSSASAYVVSHRFLIPNTTYTVEIPWRFATQSTNANEFEPFIYEYAGDLETSYQLLEKRNVDIVSIDPDDDSIVLYVFVSNITDPFRKPIEQVSDETYSSFASDLADGFYSSNKQYGIIPLNQEKKYEIVNFEHTRAIKFQNASYDDIVLEQLYFIFTNNSYIEFNFQYRNSDKVFSNQQIVEDIMNSIQDGYMYYPNP